MGENASRMIDGADCAYCGVYLEPGEIVYPIELDSLEEIRAGKTNMPEDGEPFGVPVICADCLELDCAEDGV